MSRVLTLEVSDELYAAMEKVAREESRSPEAVGLARWRECFAPHQNGKSRPATSNGAAQKGKAAPEAKYSLPADDPFAKAIGTMDSGGLELGKNHDSYIARHLLSELRNEEH